MENGRQTPNKPDQEYINDLQSKLEQMDEFNFDESVLDEYLEATAEENAPSRPINIEQSLSDFKQKHAVLIDTLYPSNENEKPSTNVKHFSTRKLVRTLVVAAAVVMVANATCIVAFGSNMFSMIAKWGDETFSFRSDFKNDNVGGIIYEDRSDGDAEPDDYKDAASVTGDGSAFYSYQESDTTAIGIEKSESEWDESGSIETFYVLNMNIVDTGKAYGINEKMFPTWVPEGFTPDYVQVTRDYFYDHTDFMANYLHEDGVREFAVSSRTLTEGKDGSIIEKDDRPVEIYTINNISWYIMHNLSRVNAAAMIGSREVSFWGDISVDEMKQIIDSVYEGV